MFCSLTYQNIHTAVNVLVQPKLSKPLNKIGLSCSEKASDNNPKKHQTITPKSIRQ